MKRTITFVILSIILCISVSAQKRNMLPNSRFETLNGAELAEWKLGSGMHFTQPTDVAIHGTYSLHIAGNSIVGSSILTSNRTFAISRSEEYQLKFKAKCTGTQAAVIKPSLECQWEAGHLPGENLFDSKTASVPADGVVREYVITGQSIDLLSGNTGCDYAVFFLNFSDMIGKDAVLTIDDVQLIRADKFGEAVGNVDINPEFTDGLTNYWLYTEQAHTLNLDFYGDGDYALSRIDLVPTSTYTGTGNGYSCFTKSFLYWQEFDTRNWSVKLTMNSDFSTSAAKLFINGDANYFKFLAPRESITGPTGTGGYTFAVQSGLHTYTFDYLAKDNGGALKPGNNSGRLYIDLNFGTQASGTVEILSQSFVEKLDLTALTIEMPNEVAIGETVPVNVWANPTNANNQVALTVNNDNGVVALDSKGVWQYTQLKSGECVITATSKESTGITAIQNVGGITAVNDIRMSNISFFVDKESKLVNINGLSGAEKIELININGQTIKTVYGQSSVSIDSLEKGLYVLRISYEGNTKVYKLIN